MAKDEIKETIPSIFDFLTRDAEYEDRPGMALLRSCLVPVISYYKDAIYNLIALDWAVNRQDIYESFSRVMPWQPLIWGVMLFIFGPFIHSGLYLIRRRILEFSRKIKDKDYELEIRRLTNINGELANQLQLCLDSLTKLNEAKDKLQEDPAFDQKILDQFNKSGSQRDSFAYQQIGSSKAHKGQVNTCSRVYDFLIQVYDITQNKLPEIKKSPKSDAKAIVHIKK